MFLTHRAERDVKIDPLRFVRSVGPFGFSSSPGIPNQTPENSLLRLVLIVFDENKTSRLKIPVFLITPGQCR